jgi:hypothetical protein
MPQRSLEERVALLEQQVAELKAQSAAPRPKEKDWRRTIGMFAGDEVMKQILDEAIKFREADRERARRRQKSKRRTKK